MHEELTKIGPTKRFWKPFLILIPLLAVLVVASVLYVHSVADTYTASGMLSFTDEEFAACDATLSNEGIVEVVSVERGYRGAPVITFHSLADGETEARFGNGAKSDAWNLRVQDGGIIEGGVDFSGWEAILVSTCVFIAVLVALFAYSIVRLRRANWYGYEMVACGGALVFFAFQLVLFLVYFVRNSFRGFSDFAYGVTTMADYFAYVSLPIMALLALLVSISNISLIRHEGFRTVNLLGIAVSVVWMLANIVWFCSADILYSLFSSTTIAMLVDSAIASAISFGECLLLSTMVCAWMAARHVPAHEMDYLVILGCGIRPDGTPSPLLAGRVDRAFTFDQDRIALGDAPAMFVPSGGQGPDEVVSEAQSMGEYLKGKGVEPERIVLEDRSTTTRENMAFSREVIEGHAGCPASEKRVAFSTTNYHVFRGYVCAHQAGMAVEGMGSKTRAYFWPNAFLREFAGLLVNQWKGILQIFALIAIFYLTAEYVLMLS